MATISKFSEIKQITDGKDMDLDLFLEYIRDGVWQDSVLSIRCIKDKKEQQFAKKKLPYVTISGTFGKREIDGLIKHSGFISIDIDAKNNPDVLDKRDLLYADKYTYAGFISVGGEGVCLIVRIQPDKHLEAFLGLEAYYFENYDLIIDPSGKDVCRPRYVSYDPELYITDKVEKFTQYVKDKAPKKVDQVVFAKDDFEDIILEIKRRGIDLVDSYYDWMRVGFALADKFGESGRGYFHTISSCSGKYNPKQCDRQYDNCLRNSGGKQAHIATFYYLVKQAGLPIYSERTKTIVNASVQGKQGGRTASQVADTLKEFEGIEDALDIINQVFNSNIESLGEDSLIDQLQVFIKHNYSLRRNEITRYIENKGVPLKQSDFNTIYIQAKKIYDKLPFELLDRLINSDNTVTYNPITEWFNARRERPEGLIEEIADCILTEDYEWCRYFFKKWIVSIVASAYGIHSPLMFVLTGEKQGTGKTEFFRRLLPKDLLPYFAESKLDAGKDDEILMTQKLLISDDEMGGKSKKDEKRLKEMLSKQKFSLREPYGRNNVDLMRLAVLCGSTNDPEILSDTTGNRRIIPVYVFSIDNERYNMVNKDLLFTEAYNLYQEGFNWKLTSEDVAKLNSKSDRFERFSSEYELLLRHFRKPAGDEENWLSATEIKNILETKSVQKIVLDRVGKELKRLGYEATIKKIAGSAKRCYNIIENNLGFKAFDSELEI